MGKILLIGADQALLYTRRLVLERCAAQVIAAYPDRARTLLKTTIFDVVVLCHSLTRRDLDSFRSEVHASPQAAALVLVASTAPKGLPVVDVDCHFVVEGAPAALVSLVERLLGGRKEARPPATDRPGDTGASPTGHPPYSSHLSVFPSPRESGKASSPLPRPERRYEGGER